MPLREESPLSFVRPESGWAVVGSFSRHFFSSSSLTPVNRSRLCLFRMGEEEETVNTLAYDAFLPSYIPDGFSMLPREGDDAHSALPLSLPPLFLSPFLGRNSGHESLLGSSEGGWLLPFSFFPIPSSLPNSVVAPTLRTIGRKRPDSTKFSKVPLTQQSLPWIEIGECLAF